MHRQNGHLPLYCGFNRFDRTVPSAVKRMPIVPGANGDSSPAIAGDRVYVGSNDGRFYVLDLASGKKLWEFEAGAPLSASPALAAGRIVIGSQDGRLYCFGQQ